MGTDDLFKKRTRANKDFVRKKASRDFKNNILIICEGKCSEKNYLELLIFQLGVKNIAFESGFGSRVNDMVKTAKENADYYQNIFCLIDKDTIKDLKKYEEKIKKLDNAKLIVSNPCFEYWILLHFELSRKNYSVSSSPCNQLIKEDLKKYLPNYKKNFDYKNVVKNYKFAYKNAKSIKDKECSYTDMHILIDFLEKIKEDDKII